MKKLLRWLSRKNIIKLYALDEKVGNGIVHCPLCKTKIVITSPNKFLVDCQKCLVELHDSGNTLRRMEFSF